jgi:hypothetical protein
MIWAGEKIGFVIGILNNNDISKSPEQPRRS